MSPSCQPYTVLNPQAKGAQDPRAASFLHLMLRVLPDIHQHAPHDAPRWLLIENVAGFEVLFVSKSSRSRLELFLKGSTTREDVLRQLLALGYSVEEFLLSPTQVGIPNSRLRYYLLATLSMNQNQNSSTSASSSVRTQFPDDGSTDEDLKSKEQTRPILDYLDVSVKEEGDLFSVPPKVLAKWGRLFDIVKPGDRRSCCFTRGEDIEKHADMA
jgi:tRNA (cytosine38-C5)-methyltransferase